MLRQSFLAAMLGLSLCGSCTMQASAQQNDGRSGAYETARNKLGLLRYCSDKGLLGAITAERAIEEVEAALRQFTVPDGAARKRGYEAQKDGEAGLWEANGKKQDLASAATVLRTTPDGLCRELAEATLNVQKATAAKQAAPKPAAPKTQLPANTPTVAVIEPASRPVTPVQAQAPLPPRAAVPLYALTTEPPLCSD